MRPSHLAATDRHVFVRSVWTHLCHFLQYLVVAEGNGNLVCYLFPQCISFCIIEEYEKKKKKKRVSLIDRSGPPYCSGVVD